MSAAVRQRNVCVKPGAYATLEIPSGNNSDTNGSSKQQQQQQQQHHHNNSSNDKLFATKHQQLLASLLVTRKNVTCYILLLTLLYIVGPTAIHIPKSLYIWASRGFDTDELLGAGIRDLVGSMVRDPHQLMVGDVDPPTPLAAYKDVLLQEYEEYRRQHEVPILSQMDPGEQGPLDTKGVWKTLFLKAMGRYTCAAPHFPKTLEAVRNSGLKAYSIMFSRLAPGQKIEPHTGFSKMIQIYHLALKVPQPKEDGGKGPYLNVQECDDEEETLNCRVETYQWTEGREFIFDDSFTHWVENPTDEERIVLFLHIKRIDFKGWREELIASIVCYIFSWFPFDSVMLLIKGTEATCAAGPPTVTIA